MVKGFDKNRRRAQSSRALMQSVEGFSTPTPEPTPEPTPVPERTVEAAPVVTEQPGPASDDATTVVDATTPADDTTEDVRRNSPEEAVPVEGDMTRRHERYQPPARRQTGQTGQTGRPYQPPMHRTAGPRKRSVRKPLRQDTRRVGAYCTTELWRAWKDASLDYEIGQSTLLNIAFDYMFLQGHIEDALAEGLADKYIDKHWVE